MGLLDGNGSGLNDRMADVLVNVFDRYDIEPGELNKKMDSTIDLVSDLKPFLDTLENRSKNLAGDIKDVEKDINELRESTEEFNNTAKNLSKDIQNLNNTFESFNSMVSEAAEHKEDEE